MRTPHPHQRPCFGVLSVNHAHRHSWKNSHLPVWMCVHEWFTGRLRASLCQDSQGRFSLQRLSSARAFNAAQLIPGVSSALAEVQSAMLAGGWKTAFLFFCVLSSHWGVTCCSERLDWWLDVMIVWIMQTAGKAVSFASAPHCFSPMAWL